MKNIIAQLRKLNKSEKTSSIVDNFFSLVFLNAVNLIFPLLTIPYLVNVLGIEQYGLLAFAVAVISYLNMVVEYGFNLTATRELSVNRQDHTAVEKIYASVIGAKVVLSAVCLLALLVLTRVSEKLSADPVVYYLTFGTVIGQALMPIWFFQAMERMKFITLATLLSKLLPTILIFLLVKAPGDYLIVPLVNGVGAIAAGIFSVIVVRYQFRVVFRTPGLSTIWKLLRDGAFLFLSQLKISLFSNTNTVLLGVLAGNTAVGYYASAEKVMRAIAMLGTPLTSVLFPYVTREIRSDVTRLAAQLTRVVKVAVSVQFVIILPVFALAGPLCRLLFDDTTGEIALVLRIILFAPVFIMINNIFGIQIMLSLKQDRQYFKILLIAGLSNLVVCTVGAYYFAAAGAATALFLIEAYVAFAMYMSGRRMLRQHQMDGQVA